MLSRLFIGHLTLGSFIVGWGWGTDSEENIRALDIYLGFFIFRYIFKYEQEVEDGKGR